MDETLADNAPLDAVLRQRIFEAQSAALQAKNAHNYTQAKILAETARSDYQSMYSRWLPRFTGRGRYSEQIEKDAYGECIDALCSAIESHELGHTLTLAAQAITQVSGTGTHFQEYSTTLRDIVSTQHAESAGGPLLDPSIMSMLTGLAVPCADELMREAISHYEQYHFHAKKFDDAVALMAPRYIPHVFPVTDADWQQHWVKIEATKAAHAHNALLLEDKYVDAIHTHHLRLINISTKQKRANDSAVRERVSEVSHEFILAQLSHFAANASCEDASVHRSDRPIMMALLDVLGRQAHTHYFAAKKDLELRNTRDCDRNAKLAIEAFQLSVHCCRVLDPESRVWLTYFVKMHMAEKLLLLNDQLRYAQAQQTVAQEAADTGDLARATLCTSAATDNLDRHDVVLKLVNLVLWEDYEEQVHAIRSTTDAWTRLRLMRQIDSDTGPVPTTVRERVLNENILRVARNNMLRTETEHLRRRLAISMRTRGIYHATQGVADAVLL